jgi:hypothetical protein
LAATNHAWWLLGCLGVETNTWQPIGMSGDIPSPRGSTSLCTYGQFLIMFGGFNGASSLNDVIAFNLKSNEWRNCANATGEWPRARAGMGYTMINNRVFYFGGFSTDENDFAELLVLDIAISE